MSSNYTYRCVDINLSMAIYMRLIHQYIVLIAQLVELRAKGSKVTGSDPARHHNTRRPQKHMTEILEVIAPAMVGPTAHKRSAGVWTLVREVS